MLSCNVYNSFLCDLEFGFDCDRGDDSDAADVIIPDSYIARPFQVPASICRTSPSRSLRAAMSLRSYGAVASFEELLASCDASQEAFMGPSPVSPVDANPAHVEAEMPPAPPWRLPAPDTPPFPESLHETLAVVPEPNLELVVTMMQCLAPIPIPSRHDDAVPDRFAIAPVDGGQ